MNLPEIIQIIIIAIIVGVTLKLTQILLTHGGPKEPSLVKPDHTKDELYLQISYLCTEYDKILAENKRLVAECQALREKSPYSVK